MNHSCIFFFYFGKIHFYNYDLSWLSNPTSRRKCLYPNSNFFSFSLSGCTFWGRRPWSRKKKILCQLGTLIGAPVGIPVVAGLAVPAIIIGIPIWIGQKVMLLFSFYLPILFVFNFCSHFKFHNTVLDF